MRGVNQMHRNQQKIINVYYFLKYIRIDDRCFNKLQQVPGYFKVVRIEGTDDQYKIADKLCGGCMELDFNKVSESIYKILSDHSKIQSIAKKLKDVSDIYVLGRGIHFPIALEASLKLKEITYIHAEGLPGGELKHGPLALMDSNVYVIIINPNDSTYTDTLASAHEIKARGAKILGISDIPNEVYDYWIEIPTISEALFPLIEIIPIQLLAYYSALEKDTDPDYPRNLAKSVTVK